MSPTGGPRCRHGTARVSRAARLSGAEDNPARHGYPAGAAMLLGVADGAFRSASAGRAAPRLGLGVRPMRGRAPCATWHAASGVPRGMPWAGTRGTRHAVCHVPARRRRPVLRREERRPPREAAHPVQAGPPRPLSTARRSQPVANAHCCVANAHCCVANAHYSVANAHCCIANAVRSASSPSRSDVSAGPRIASSPSTPSIEPVAVCAPAHANAPGSFPDARLRVPRVSTESTPCEKIQSSPASTQSVQFADQFMRENPGSFADVLGDIGGFSSSSLVGPALSSCNLTV